MVCVCVCVCEREKEGGREERDSVCLFCLIFSAEVHKDQFSKLIKQVRERQDNDDDGCDLGEKESELRQITGRNSDCDNRERLTTQIL